VPADSEAVSAVLPDIDAASEERGKRSNFVIAAEDRAVAHGIAVCATRDSRRRQAWKKRLLEGQIGQVVNCAFAQADAGVGDPTGSSWGGHDGKCLIEAVASVTNSKTLEPKRLEGSLEVCVKHAGGYPERRGRSKGQTRAQWDRLVVALRRERPVPVPHEAA
jgi:hypothetical protein